MTYQGNVLLSLSPCRTGISCFCRACYWILATNSENKIISFEATITPTIYIGNALTNMYQDDLYIIDIFPCSVHLFVYSEFFIVILNYFWHPKRNIILISYRSKSEDMIRILFKPELWHGGQLVVLIPDRRLSPWTEHYCCLWLLMSQGLQMVLSEKALLR